MYHGLRRSKSGKLLHRHVLQFHDRLLGISKVMYIKETKSAFDDIAVISADQKSFNEIISETVFVCVHA